MLKEGLFPFSTPLLMPIHQWSGRLSENVGIFPVCHPFTLTSLMKIIGKLLESWVRAPFLKSVFSFVHLKKSLFF